MPDTEEASAPDDGAAPDISRRDEPGQRPRSPLLSIVIVALAFAFGTGCAYEVTAGLMSHPLRQFRGGLWLCAIGLSLLASLRLRDAMALTPGDPQRQKHNRRATDCLAVAAVLAAFPLLVPDGDSTNALVDTQGYYASILDTVRAACWGGCLICFAVADDAFRRRREPPEGVAPQGYAATLLAAGVALMAVPSLVNLWLRSLM